MPLIVPDTQTDPISSARGELPSEAALIDVDAVSIPKADDALAVAESLVGDEAMSAGALTAESQL